MENVIAEMLENEIRKTLKEVSDAQTGSEQAKAALMKLEKLNTERMKELEQGLKDQQRIDSSYLKSEENSIRKAELEQRVKQAEADLEMKQEELNQKQEELKEAKRSRRWRTVLDLCGIGLPIAASAYWMKRGLQFEEEGKVYSSRTGQWLSQHLRLFGKKG